MVIIRHFNNASDVFAASSEYIVEVSAQRFLAISIRISLLSFLEFS